MKSKSPFAMKSPLNAYRNDQKGNYANPAYVKEEMVGVAIGKAMTKAGGDIFSGLEQPKVKKVNEITPQTFKDLKPFEIANAQAAIPETSRTTETKTTEGLRTLFKNKEESQWAKNNPEAWQKALKEKKQQTTKSRTISTIGDTTLESDWTSAAGQMKGSPNKLIGDTMNINPGAVPPNQAQNDLGAQPIISADGSQPNARAIDIAAIANPYATPGADFNPQSKMKAESIFGSPMQRQGLMNLGTPLHHDSEKQSHSHPSKTTTKMKPDGEYPGARYVKGDLVDQDDLLDKTKLDAHIATQVQSDKKGTFIKEKSDDGPGSDIETSKGFGKKIRLGSMGRSSYTSNMKDQLDPNDFLFKNTPKK